MEKRDLYDENRQVTGETINKNDDIPLGRYILIVMAFIQNNAGEFLIQKRSLQKGGEWSFTGGHPKAGESSIDGLKTEVQEELGIKIENPILFKQAKGSNTYCDLYYIKQNIKKTDIHKQDEEVEQVCFKTKNEIKKMYDENNFKKGHYMMFKDCIDYLEKNGS